jgi:hypothetical protein
MATPRISVRLPPNVDPTKSSLAYGERQLLKLNGELKSQELLTKQQALRALCDVMHRAENIAESLRVGKARLHGNPRNGRYADDDSLLG